MKKKNNRVKTQKCQHKQSFNMYYWSQKNKKLFASIICFVLIIGLLVGLVQI